MLRVPMKICPQCQERYDDDVETCPKDGEPLVAFDQEDPPEDRPGNPKLLDVVAASPADRTSMIDLEAMEAKRAAKRAADAAARAASGEASGEDDDERTPPPEQPLEADGDATGTLQRTK